MDLPPIESMQSFEHTTVMTLDEAIQTTDWALMRAFLSLRSSAPPCGTTSFAAPPVANRLFLFHQNLAWLMGDV